jgi:putative CocE/NonD family hydrolase
MDGRRILQLACASGAGALALLGAQPAAAGEAAPAASPAVFSPLPIRQMFGVETRMRDGTVLVSDVWLPEAPGRYPVILVRTPYLRTQPEMGFAATAKYFAEHGYAYVVQDVRGRGDSGGDFDFFFQEAKDGYDAVEGVAAEPWSNGRVCMMGISYLGSVQWLAAKERPPHLVCIAPDSPGLVFQDEIPRMGGAFMMMWALGWLNDVSGHIGQGPNMAATDFNRVFSHRPLLTMDEAFGRKMRLFREFLEHDTLDDYWKRAQMGPEDFARIDIPVLVNTGWFDGDQRGALFAWRGMHERPGGARDEFLTIGPWTHIQSYLGGAEKMGGFNLPKDSIVDNKAAHLAFYDHYLKQDGSSFDRPRVRVFVTGANVWRDFDAYPVPAKQTRLYLDSAGKANTAAGDGALSWSIAARGGSDAYVYDPKNPVPLDLMAGLFGMDRAKEQARQDVLVYTSRPLDKPLEIIGPVSVDLYAATDARDTDFTAAITDVGPDGKALLLGSRPIGIIRARYRNGRAAEPSLLTPGKPELYHIALGEIGHAFLPGHRIRIEISSSAYPMFNPNQNTGNPIATDTEWKTANQKILHDRAHPSALVLPVVDPGS